MSDSPKPNGQPNPTPPETSRNRAVVLDSGAEVVLSLDAPNFKMYDDLAVSQLPDAKDAPPPAK